MTLGAAAEHSASSPVPTALPTALGAAMAFGCNDDGQLGTGERRRLSIAIDTVTASNLPAQIGVLHELDITAISCGSRHTMVLTTAGEVYSFGWGSVRGAAWS
jgi:alpha-tubulin suppressor-like RCC1 family protein